MGFTNGERPAPVAKQQSIPKRPRKERKSSGPSLKAMPRITGKVVFNDERLVEIRQRHQKELSGKTNEQVVMREGFVYVIRNPAWPGALKIGSALDYEARLSQYQTGDPHRGYELVFAEFFEDRKVAENTVHHRLIERRLTGEWFEVSAEFAISMIKEAKKPASADEFFKFS